MRDGTAPNYHRFGQMVAAILSDGPVNGTSAAAFANIITAAKDCGITDPFHEEAKEHSVSETQ